MKIPENYLFTLLELRQAKGYSQRDIAKKLKITQGYYNEIEKGKKILFGGSCLIVAKKK